jgi:Fic family protein
MSWPGTGVEKRTWDPPPERAGVTRAERAAIGRTYEAAVPPQIAELTPHVSGAVAAMSEEAVAEIRAFDAESKGEAGAFASILLRTESASSSQIEQLTASARAIAEAEVTSGGAGNAAVIAANTDAMTAALRLADALDVGAIIEMQRALLQATAPQMLGLREEPVWIGGAGSTPVTADLVPPAHERVKPALTDLVAFMRRDDLPVLIQAAVAHAQFETIHPFADGNGRTGRAMVHALLRGKGVTTRVTVPVSGGLLQDKAAYIEALDAYRAGHIEPIVRSFAVSALHAVQHGRTMWKRLDAVKEKWKGSVKARSDSAVWRLLDVLIAHPVLDAEIAAKELKVSETNVHRHLATLTEAGVLVRSQHYKSRRTLWRAPDVLEVVDAYSEDVGRRQR